MGLRHDGVAASEPAMPKNDFNPAFTFFSAEGLGRSTAVRVEPNSRRLQVGGVAENGKRRQQAGEGAPDTKRQKKQAAASIQDRQPQEVLKGRGKAGGQGPRPQQAAGRKGKGAKDGYYDDAPAGTSYSAQGFSDLNLSRPLLRACEAMGYAQPTPIQAAVIPLAMSGRDICGSAVTGSGKTAAFALPLLERLLFRRREVAATYALVLTPVRELAEQICGVMTQLAQFTDVRVALVVGGLPAAQQAAALRSGPEVVVATPGRLIDHVHNTQSFGCEDIAVLVLDEADRLLEMGFKEEIQEIVRRVPRKRQTMLFSATFSAGVEQLAALSLQRPVRLAADVAAAVPKTLTQEVIRLKGAAAADKEALLLHLCSSSKGLGGQGGTIVFFRTRAAAHRVKLLFDLAGLPAAAELHGDLTQAARLSALQRFRGAQVMFLLATDVAARGIDVPGVRAVVNFDCPRTLDAYLHRIGRTARAGAGGTALSLVEDKDRQLMKEVTRRTGVTPAARQVTQQAYAPWREKISSLSAELSSLLAAEREERQLARAEMEAARAANLVEHAEEIAARPPRTWFMTPQQKKAARRRAEEEASRGGGGGGGRAEEDEGEGRGGQGGSGKKKGGRQGAGEGAKGQQKHTTGGRGGGTVEYARGDIQKRSKRVKEARIGAKQTGKKRGRSGAGGKPR